MKASKLVEFPPAGDIVERRRNSFDGGVTLRAGVDIKGKPTSAVQIPISFGLA